MKIRRVGLFAAGLAVALLGVSMTSAQSPEQNDLKKLQVEVQQLRDQLKSLEAKIAKAQGSSDTKKEAKNAPPFGGKGFGKGFGKLDPEKKKEMAEHFKKWAEGKKKEVAKGAPPWAGKGWGRGGFGEKGKESAEKSKKFGEKGKRSKEKYKKDHADPARHIERRLEHIIGELESLRRELKKK